MRNVNKFSVVLLSLLMASCTMTPAQSPYKAGTTFTLDGVTKDKQAVHRTITLIDDGTDEDDAWSYNANGISKNSTFLNITKDFSIIVVLESLKEGSPQLFLCALQPDLGTIDWKIATGALISGDFDEMKDALLGAKRIGQGSTYIQRLKASGGDCTLTRS